ncbi:MAG: hypothetical protein AB7F23_08955 [Phycisphaerae bacterium]
MRSQIEFVGKLKDLLEACGIEYMLTGSLSGSFYGHPRATNDADIVIEATEPKLRQFIARLDDDYYVSETAALEALKNSSMFNVIDTSSGWKADLIIRKQRDFSREEFLRRRRILAQGIEIFSVSPEDSILSKLEWAHGRSSKLQYDDIIGIISIQWDTLDTNYLQTWAKKLGIADDLAHLMEEAEKLRT